MKFSREKQYYFPKGSINKEQLRKLVNMFPNASNYKVWKYILDHMDKGTYPYSYEILKEEIIEIINLEIYRGATITPNLIKLNINEVLNNNLKMDIE